MLGQQIREAYKLLFEHIRILGNYPSKYIVCCWNIIESENAHFKTKRNIATRAKFF